MMKGTEPGDRYFNYTKRLSKIIIIHHFSHQTDVEINVSEYKQYIFWKIPILILRARKLAAISI